MAKVDSTILDLEESAQDLEVFADFDLDPQSPKLANALFGSARQRVVDKVKAAASRRDSPTLPWRSTDSRSKSGQTFKDTGPARRPPPRSSSPDIQTILATTPRPRKNSSAALPASRSSSYSSPSKLSPKSSREDTLVSEFGSLLELDSDLENGDGGSESDSSLDIHTPLPHLMFRDGLLSPRSKLLPPSLKASPEASPYSYEDGESSIRSGSVLSLASTTGSTMTGLLKDPRNTPRRQLRHRDGRLLRAGMGLTTGLGWSDSEDEDAPSPLTRRLIGTAIERKRSASLMASPRPMSQYTEAPASRLTSPVPASKPDRAASYSNLRSASVSFPTQGSSGLRFPRAVSAASPVPPSSTTSPIASPPLGMVRLPRERSDSSVSISTSGLTERSLVGSPIPEDTVPTPTAKSRPQLPRSRTASNASNSSVSTALSHSTSNTTWSSSALSKSVSNPSLPRIPRQRTESSASTSTTATSSQASSASHYSQNSSSTASSGSTVPRPLRLPQTAALKKIPSRSFSQDHYNTPKPPPAAPAPTSPIAQYQRQRTLSNPQTSIRLPILPATASHGQVRTTSNSLSSGVLPPGAPPTLRQKPTLNGPRPRTGTGMAYRTSSVSYASFHESGSKMRALSLSTRGQKGVAAS